MRILLLAPRSIGVNSDNEIELLTRQYQTHILIGQVTERRIFSSIAPNQEYDVIHIAAHIRDSTIVLSDDEHMSTATLCQLAKLVGAKLVFINSSSSADMGMMLANQGVHAIATIRQISDSQARLTTHSFYMLLAKQSSTDLANCYEVFEYTIGIATSYIFLRGRVPVSEQAKILGIDRKPDKISQQSSVMRQLLQKLKIW